MFADFKPEQLLSVNYSFQANARIRQLLEPHPWKGSRVLVPITVEALVIEPDDNQTWAETRLNIEALKQAEESGELTGKVYPEPFSEMTDEEVPERRAPGVHLHWALPDGLTQGEAVQSEGEEPSPPDNVDPDQVFYDEDSPADNVEFPKIPDCWLVIRLYANDGDTHRRSRAWVVESELNDFDFSAKPVESWSPSTVENRQMTAVGTGDPSFMAYYDNSRHVLGFHDSLEDVEAGPLTYVVMGWYSNIEDDPLYEPKSRKAWTKKLNDLGFALTDKARVAAIRAAKYARARDTRDDGFSSQAVNFENYEYADTYNAVIKYAEVDEVVKLNQIDFLFRDYFPRQMLCHGMVYDVRWNGVGGRYARNKKPPPSDLTVSIGNTGVEAMSRILAEQTDRSNAYNIFSSFQYGLLSQLSKPDGVTTLQALLHAEQFASFPGGYYYDQIVQGDAIEKPPVKDYPKRTTPPTGSYMDYLEENNVDIDRTFRLANRDLSDAKITNSYWHGSEIMYATDAARERLADRLQRVVDQHKVTVRRAMPRFWQPKDPVILLSGPNRSMKHGEDGRFTEDGKLVCRFSGNVVTELEVAARYRVQELVSSDRTPEYIYSFTRFSVNPYDALPYNQRPNIGRMPPEVSELLTEMLLLDEVNAPYYVDELNQQLIANPAPESDVSSIRYINITGDDLVSSVQVAQTLIWGPIAPEVRTQFQNPEIISDLGGVVGTAPSKVGINLWQQPWTPLHLDWEVSWYPTPEPVDDWRLSNEGLVQNLVNEEGALSAGFETYRGRTLLTPGVARTFQRQVETFLENEPEGDEGEATGSQETTLKDVLDQLKKSDILATSIAGFHDLLLGLEEQLQFQRSIELQDLSDTRETVDADTIFPVRAGHLSIRRLRIVDAFGQVVDIDYSQPHDTPLGTVLMDTGEDDEQHSFFRMPPRITSPSRLMFRMLGATDDTKEARTDRSPVCGWILPDHLDESVEVYDSAGNNLGQIQLQVDDAGQEWYGVPGQSPSLSALPSIGNSHLSNFVDGLLDWAVRDAAYAEQVKLSEDTDETLESRESALSAFLRTIDATAWTIDPLGREGSEHLAVLIGRPLALVRAKITLEVQPYEEKLAHLNELDYPAFPVRLGDIQRLHDGLMGYFVDDDYSQFYPVHEDIASKTRAFRPRQSFLGPIHTVPGFFEHVYKNDNLVEIPIDHPYINQEPYVMVRPGETRMLTLLIDPRGDVHLASGFLPMKDIGLIRDHVAPALSNMSITFRIGPVLSDPTTIRMPLQSEIKGAWSWVRRTGATVWQEDPVVNATADALLPDTPASLMEGWLKLSDALGDESS